MREVSIGARVARQLAAIEVGAAKYQFIEIEHQFVGALSLEKVVALCPERAGLSPQSWHSLQVEYRAVGPAWGTWQLRRLLPDRLPSSRRAPKAEPKLGSCQVPLAPPCAGRPASVALLNGELWSCESGW